MADCTVTSLAGTHPLRVLQGAITLSAIPLKVTYSSTAYATATGGLPFDLFAFLALQSPLYAGINYKDIMGLLPLGCTAEKFVVDGSSFAIGTPTATTLPCTIRILGTGAAEHGALAEIDDASISGSFDALLLVSRGGAN